MKTPRNALAQLGKLVAKDLAQGRMSSGMCSVGEALSDAPDSVLTLLDLLLAEARKKRSSEPLIAGYLFMMREALQVIRIRMENGEAEAEAIIGDLKAALSRATQDGKAPPGVLLLVAQQFAGAKLDVGDEFRELMLELPTEALDDDQRASADQLAAHYREMADALDHDPFLIHANLAESLSAFPEEQRAGIIGFIVMSDVPSIREAALGWLLDESVVVSGNTAFLLTEAAAHGLVSARSVNRLVTLRNWLPEDRRGAVDAVIRASRKQGFAAEAAPAVEVQDVIASLCDGSGAQSFFVILKRGRRFALASLLLKHGEDVRDAWVRDDLRKAELGAILGEIGLEMDAFATSLDVIRICPANALAVGLQRDALPPFGLLQVLEATGMTDVKPTRLPTGRLVEQLLGDLSDKQKTEARIARALKASRDWAERYVTLESWFEVGDDVGAIVAARKTKKARAEAVLARILPETREKWADRLAWSALVAQNAADDEDWVDFALVARELLQERPLQDIPLAAWLAANTVEAAMSIVRFR